MRGVSGFFWFVLVMPLVIFVALYRLYKPLAPKLGLNGLRCACTSSNKCVTPELGTAKLRCHGTENFENRKFHEKITLVTSETIKFYDFSSLTRISLLAAFALHIIM